VGSTLPSRAPPRPRNQHSMVYDPNSNRVVVFGGMVQATGELLNDVWVLTHANGEGGTPEWIRLPTSGNQPLARRQAVAVYGKSSNRMIVSTGHGPGGTGGYLFNDALVLTNASGNCTRTSHAITRLRRVTRTRATR